MGKVILATVVFLLFAIFLDADDGNLSVQVVEQKPYHYKRIDKNGE